MKFALRDVSSSPISVVMGLYDLVFEYALCLLCSVSFVNEIQSHN